jgi:co-chaperonin GroES (HSP10)
MPLEECLGKLLQASVVAVGSGSTKGEEIQPFSVTVRDKVLLPAYGDSKVAVDDKGYFSFRASGILGKLLPLKH